MADYDNTNRGALFRNDKKEKETHPDYKGSINANGVDYWLSAWVNEAKSDGKKYFSLSLTPKEQQAAKPAQAAPAAGTDDEFNDDLPF